MTLNRRRCPLLVAFAGWVVLPSNLRAAPVTFAFRGTVNLVYNTGGVQPGELPTVGDRFAGTYTFDPAAAPPGPSDGRLGQRMDGSVGNLRFSGEGPEITAEESQGRVRQDWYRLYDEVRLLPPPSSSRGIDYWVINLTLGGTDELLSGRNLSAAPPRLEFATLENSIGLYGDSSWNVGPLPIVGIEATLDSLTVVPEPTAAAPICVAAMLLLTRRSGGGRRA